MISFFTKTLQGLNSFKGRTQLIGSLSGSNCSLEIDLVRNNDNGPYCFSVGLRTSDKDKYSFMDNCVSIQMIGKCASEISTCDYST